MAPVEGLNARTVNLPGANGDFVRQVIGPSRLAKEILGTCLGVKAKDRVWIQSWDHTLDLAEALASECWSVGCQHLLTVRYEGVWLRSILKSTKEQLETVPQQEAAALAETDFFVFSMGPRSPVPWDSIPEEKRGSVSVWLDTRYDRSSYAKQWARLASRYRVKMLGVESTLATPERAKAWGLNYEEWRDDMIQGCLADPDKIAKRARALDEVASGRGHVSITTGKGTNLELDLDGRPTGISDGIASEEKARKAMITFLPAGAIEVSVNEESANGTLLYDVPIQRGKSRVEGLKVFLRDGEIIRHEAVAGEANFSRYLREGGRDAGRIAFIGFGLNPNLRHGFTQDDKILGELTIGFGDNEAKGGRNRGKGDWWASITKATVTVDGLRVMRNGRLLV